MTLIRNLFFLLSITLFAVVSSILAIYNYNPFESNVSVFINFYASFTIALAGILAICLYLFKIKLTCTAAPEKFFWPSVVEAVIAAAGLVTLLALQGLRILDWLVGISVIIITILLELFFRTKKRVL